MKTGIKILVITLLANLLIACSDDKATDTPRQRTYEVKSEQIHKSLYFTGTIKPLRESPLTAPLEANIEAMNYHYGQMVKKGTVVFILNSAELQKQFNDTLTDYLKAKDSFTVAKAKFNGTQELWDAGLISKNNYLSEKSSLNTSRVTLIQATRKLSEMLDKMDEDNKQDLSTLNIAEFEKVRQALTGQHNLIRLKASSEGILLYPPKSTGDEGSGQLTVGSSVKSGQVLALIGDLNGVSVEIDVPEIDIDKIHAGMKASITGVALGKQTLKGEVVSVNAQAVAGSSSSLPSFTAVVEVNKLTPEQKKWIKVGMSASIALEADTESQILVPLLAVRQERGLSMVTVRTQDGRLITKPVVTGGAQSDKVIIQSGLQAGDVVVYDQ
ncbi:efflux RND transporter periplasmic adaptor subunit [Legionella dresdenensis]|uniref:Efflux RND transporter periplasmic adaptor subunit n=1 Tax=Legionella dresdenensis TaxID=450200 RepID=A0ABV8CDA2_9GAMM